MNVNEVVANRALEFMGYEKGRYDIVHPNDDVNMSQSTNDVYPTAVRLAILLSKTKLLQAVSNLAAAFEEKDHSFADIQKLGRTKLQDAVPMALGQEFLAIEAALREDVEKLDHIAFLFLEVNLGGTAIGTSINATPEYRKKIIRELSALTDLEFKSATNLIEASWDTGAFVLFSGMLKRLATKLSKIANDLRLLSSGPRGGLGEISLPPVQPGSSIMPGKVNPVIPEMVNQVAFHVIGGDVTVTLAAEAGQLQLNAMEPVMAQSVLNSMRLLTKSVEILQNRCVVGITANVDQCERHLHAGTALATSLVPILGYESSVALAKEILASGKSFADVLNDLDEADRKKVLLATTGS